MNNLFSSNCTSLRMEGYSKQTRNHAKNTFTRCHYVDGDITLVRPKNKLVEQRRTLTKHYASDAEKQRAAAWLLDNMQYHGTVRSELQDEYYNKLTRIAHNAVYPQCESLIYSLADFLASLTQFIN